VFTVHNVRIDSPRGIDAAQRPRRHVQRPYEGPKNLAVQPLLKDVGAELAARLSVGEGYTVAAANIASVVEAAF